MYIKLASELIQLYIVILCPLHYQLFLYFRPRVNILGSTGLTPGCLTPILANHCPSEGTDANRAPSDVSSNVTQLLTSGILERGIKHFEPTQLAFNWLEALYIQRPAWDGLMSILEVCKLALNLIFTWYSINSLYNLNIAMMFANTTTIQIIIVNKYVYARLLQNQWRKMKI